MVSILKELREGKCSTCVFFGVIVIIAVVYFAIAPFVSAELLNDIVDGPLMVIALTAGVYYASWTMLNCRKMIDRAMMLRFGVCLAWIGTGFWRIDRALYSTGLFKGAVGVHDATRGFWILVLLIAGICHILAIDMEGSKPQRSKVVAAVASSVAGLLLIAGIRLLEH